MVVLTPIRILPQVLHMFYTEAFFTSSTAVPDYIVLSFFFLVIGFRIFNILDSSLKFSGKSTEGNRLALHLVEMDTDPDPAPDPDRQAPYADLDPPK